MLCPSALPGPDTLCVGARRPLALFVEPRRFVCRAPARSVSGPGALSLSSIHPVRGPPAPIRVPPPPGACFFINPCISFLTPDFFLKCLQSDPPSLTTSYQPPYLDFDPLWPQVGQSLVGGSDPPITSPSLKASSLGLCFQTQSLLGIPPSLFFAPFSEKAPSSENPRALRYPEPVHSGAPLSRTLIPPLT